MTNRSATYLIMTLVAIIIICGIVSCGKAHAARGCLQRDEAQRTWPTKQLGLDEDGCWTYLRRGVTQPKKPVIEAPLIEVPVGGPARAAAEIYAAVDLVQRWPLEQWVERRPEVEIKPMMTPGSVVTVLMVLLFAIAMFEIAHMVWRRRR